MLATVPGLQLVGGAVVLGALAYENREWIGDRMDDAGEAAAGALGVMLAGARRTLQGRL